MTDRAPEPAQRRSQAPAIWIGVAVLAIVHNDLWWWHERSLVFGFLPVGLAYHALFSVIAAVLWALAIRFAWPHHLEDREATGET